MGNLLLFGGGDFCDIRVENTLPIKVFCQLLGAVQVHFGRTVLCLPAFKQAFPFGGVGCMQALIEACDCRVTKIEDGSQPPYKP